MRPKSPACVTGVLPSPSPDGLSPMSGSSVGVSPVGDVPPAGGVSVPESFDGESSVGASSAIPLIVTSLIAVYGVPSEFDKPLIRSSPAVTSATL